MKSTYTGFGGCINLVELTLPHSIVTISGYSIRDTHLTELVIPANVAEIGSQALASNAYLTKVTMLGTTPPIISPNNFADAYRYFYVPASALDTYKAADIWSAHANNIIAIDD